MRQRAARQRRGRFLTGARAGMAAAGRRTGRHCALRHPARIQLQEPARLQGVFGAQAGAGSRCTATSCASGSRPCGLFLAGAPRVRGARWPLSWAARIGGRAPAASPCKPAPSCCLILVGGIAFIFGLFLVSAPARAYREARMFKLVWNNVGVSRIARFKCDLRARRYVLLRVKNMLLTLLTLGFFRPFAMVSEYRMKTESVTLHVKGGLDQLVGQLAREQGGLGDALADAVGLDLVGCDDAPTNRSAAAGSTGAAARRAGAGQPAAPAPRAVPAPARTRARRRERSNWAPPRSAGPSAGAPAARRARVAVDLREHGSLEMDDVAGWQAALAAARRQAARSRSACRPAGRSSWRWCCSLVAWLGAFYRWGTPWAATQVTRQVPLDWETALVAARPAGHGPSVGSSPASCLPTARRNCANASTRWRASSSRACTATAAMRRAFRCRSAPAWAPTLSPCPAEPSS